MVYGDFKNYPSSRKCGVRGKCLQANQFFQLSLSIITPSIDLTFKRLMTVEFYQPLN